MTTNERHTAIWATYQAREFLKTVLVDGQGVYARVVHKSRSGLTQTVGLYVLCEGQLRNIGSSVADLLGMRYDYERGGVVTRGGGADVCADTVEQRLSRSMSLRLQARVLCPPTNLHT